MTDDGFAVQITLTVRPENQQALIDTVRGAGDPADVPGLRAISLLRSPDGTRVINHMRWDSEAAFQAARATLPLVERTRAAARRLAETATTSTYAVIELG